MLVLTYRVRRRTLITGPANLQIFLVWDLPSCSYNNIIYFTLHTRSILSRANLQTGDRLQNPPTFFLTHVWVKTAGVAVFKLF